MTPEEFEEKFKRAKNWTFATATWGIIIATLITSSAGFMIGIRITWWIGAPIMTASLLASAIAFAVIQAQIGELVCKRMVPSLDTLAFRIAIAKGNQQWEGMQFAHNREQAHLAAARALAIHLLRVNLLIKAWELEFVGWYQLQAEFHQKGSAT